MTPERITRIREVLAQRQPDLTVIADQMHKERNLSAVVRTCDAVGIQEVHSIIPEGGYQPYRRAARGSHHWVTVKKHTQLENALSPLQAKDYQVVATVVDQSSICFREVDYTKPTVLVLGGEVNGVSELARESADALVTIPMLGMIESYNVSVAAAIILLEAQRQRTLAGLYDKVRIDEDLYRHLAFKWSHPKLARACEEKGVPFPETREDGEVLDPQGLSVLLNKKRG